MTSPIELTARERAAFDEALESVRNGEVDLDDENTILVAFKTTEGWLDADGEPIPKGADVLVGYRGKVIERERAEANGYEIWGSVVGDARPQDDPVRVPFDYGDRSLPGAAGEEGGD